MPLPRPEGDRGKDSRGRVLVVGGGAQTPGAVLLAGVAALRSGAGKLQIATARSVAPHIAIAMPEALVAALDENEEGGPGPDTAESLLERIGRCDALLFGPGLPETEATAQLTARLLAGVEPDGPALLLDAAALSGLLDQAPALARLDGRVVITPHAGEMASLLDRSREAVEADPLAVAREVAGRLRVVVALKGPSTHIATPDGRAWVNESGCIGLGTSGSGDTLAGLVAGLLARGAEPAQALLWGVHVHAEAGARLAKRIGEVGFLARELPGEMPAILAELSR
jgi:hydroxyethylthiazole kinase-like uncharacterized protein yjeF